MSGWSPFTNKIDPPKKNVNKKNLSAPEEQTREILPSLVTPTHASKSGKLVNTFSSPIPFIPKVVNKKIRRKKITEEDVGKPKSSAFPKTSPFKEDESNPEYRDNNNLFTDYNESIDLNKDGKIQEEEVDAYREQMRAKSSKYKGNLGPQEKPYSSDQSTYGQLWDRGASEIKDMSDKENQWLGYRKTNWSHAFSIVDFFESGYFTVHVIQIIKGKTSLWGEIIDGNK